MPDSQGVITAEEMARINQWLASKWKADRRCPVCLSIDWALGTHFVSVFPSSPPPLSARLQYPYFMLVCNHCGNTRFFNAVTAGVMPAHPEAQRGQ